MSHKFKVGEIVNVVGDINGNNPHTIGIEVEIISLLNDRYDYETMDANGISWFARESELRRKKRPEGVSSYEEIEKLVNWNPTKVTISNT